MGRKTRKVWIWLALDRESREIVAVHMGHRSKKGAEKLWAALPESYRQNARGYTDFWMAYAEVFPPDLHRPVGKETGKTSHIERFNTSGLVGWFARPSLFLRNLRIISGHLVFYSPLQRLFANLIHYLSRST